MPARPWRRGGTLVHREARDPAREEAEEQRVGVEAGDRECDRDGGRDDHRGHVVRAQAAEVELALEQRARDDRQAGDEEHRRDEREQLGHARAEDGGGQDRRHGDGEQREHAARDDAQRGDGLDVPARDRLALDERRAVAGPREAVGDLVDDHHDRDRAELRRRDQVGEDDHRRERQDLRPDPHERGPAHALDRRLADRRVDRRAVSVGGARVAHDTSAGPLASTWFSASTTSSWSASIIAGLSGRLRVRSEMSLATGSMPGSIP